MLSKYTDNGVQIMDTSILEGLGLSKGEIKVYLTLLELGITKVGKVIEKSGMASSGVHNCVHSLKDKGLVSFVKKGKVCFYRAVSPKLLVSFVDDKKKQLLTILPELEMKQKFSEERQEAEVFVGKKGIIVMLNLLIEDAKRGDEYVFFPVRADNQDEEIQRFFLNYDLKRAEKKLKLRGLSPPELKHLFKNRRMHHMKYPKFPLPSNISICKDKICFFSWGEKPVGYMIRSRQIVDMYKQYFEDVWRIC